MSDAAIVTIVTGTLTALASIVASVAGCVVVWLKLKYGLDEAKKAATKAATNASRVEEKINDTSAKLDVNTSLTAQAKDAAKKASEHAVVCNEERAQILKGLADHDARIGDLETQLTAVKLTLDGVTKNIDSTRHEMRGQLQAVVSKLDLITINLPRPVAVVPQATEPK